MEKPDAGLRGLDHYRNRLPSWRYYPRKWLIPLVRWETPYLAKFQNAIRTPTLDSYFAMTANLGTHTFFMIFLPILFWCGWTSIGRGLVHLLAAGVFFSGFVKDLLCLPRPLSPPLARITMSGYAALEYGFPSTHSTNAVSVAVYALLHLRSSTNTLAPALRTAFEILAYSYATSIVVGRLYCGMHGFFDVIVGSILGAGLGLIDYLCIDMFDKFVLGDSIKALLIVILIILVLIRIHPEPADDCPCFDDSVAFAGVVCGIEFGHWHFAQTTYSWNTPVPATTPFDFAALGWVKAVARMCLGILSIIVWKESAKPILLKILPPIFRIFEHVGLILPRKFFKQASEYDTVPGDIKTDNVMPSVSALPNFISNIRHPRRSNSISIGPQSAADAYEELAFRQKKRRESLSSEVGRTSGSDRNIFGSNDPAPGYDVKKMEYQIPMSGLLPTPPSSESNLSSNLLPPPILGNVPLTPIDSNQDIPNLVRTPSQDRRENEKEEREIFSSIQRPRVRYDVEVITKLIVYSGIGLIAVEGAPILFYIVGLGAGKRPI